MDGEDEPRPFAPPKPEPEVSASPSKDPSVENEPWMQPHRVRPQQGESPLVAPELEPEVAQHSVWDEPGLSKQLSGETPDAAVTWYRFYLKQVDKTSKRTTWLTALSVAGSSGLLAVFGALIATPSGWATVVLAAPLVEEILKIALTIWVVEQKPWLFRHRQQILFCGACSGLIFAFLENLLYLRWYIPDPSYELIFWRWTVCVGLHTLCSSVAACGAATVWLRFRRERRPPRLSDGTGLFILAIAIHAVYNLLAVLLEVSLGWF